MVPVFRLSVNVPVWCLQPCRSELCILTAPWWAWQTDFWSGTFSSVRVPSQPWLTSQLCSGWWALICWWPREMFAWRIIQISPGSICSLMHQHKWEHVCDAALRGNLRWLRLLHCISTFSVQFMQLKNSSLQKATHKDRCPTYGNCICPACFSVLKRLPIGRETRMSGSSQLSLEWVTIYI